MARRRREPRPFDLEKELVVLARLHPLPLAIRGPAFVEAERLYDEYAAYRLRPDCARWETDRAVKIRMLEAVEKVVGDAEVAASLLPKPPRHRL